MLARRRCVEDHVGDRAAALAFSTLLSLVPLLLLTLSILSWVGYPRATLAQVESCVTPADSMLIVLSAPTRVYSLDVDYEYRQDSNLYYLTGIVHSMNEKGDAKVDKFFFSRQFASGCDAHPDLEEHGLIAQELTGFLKGKMN